MTKPGQKPLLKSLIFDEHTAIEQAKVMIPAAEGHFYNDGFGDKDVEILINNALTNEENPVRGEFKINPKTEDIEPDNEQILVDRAFELVQQNVATVVSVDTMRDLDLNNKKNWSTLFIQPESNDKTIDLESYWKPNTLDQAKQDRLLSSLGLNRAEFTDEDIDYILETFTEAITMQVNIQLIQNERNKMEVGTEQAKALQKMKKAKKGLRHKPQKSKKRPKKSSKPIQKTPPKAETAQQVDSSIENFDIFGHLASINPTDQLKLVRKFQKTLSKK